MCEWVHKRHMTDFEMNVHRERAALAKKKLYSMQTANPLRSERADAFRRAGQRGREVLAAKSLESRSALCRLICGNRRKYSFFAYVAKAIKKQTKNSMIKKVKLVCRPRKIRRSASHGQIRLNVSV